MNTAREARAPVFVDDSGRRWWIVRMIGWLLATTTVVAVALSVVALSVSPSVASTAHPAHTTPEARLSVGAVASQRP
jgi:hypothetical protein